MRFGEYLVKIGRIHETQLLEAVLAQMENVPPPVAILYSAKLLSAEQCLECLRQQDVTGHDFITVARKLGHWNSRCQQAIEREVNLRRPPMGEFLVQKGILSQETLLHDFQNWSQMARRGIPTTAQARLEIEEGVQALEGTEIAVAPDCLKAVEEVLAPLEKMGLPIDTHMIPDFLSLFFTSHKTILLARHLKEAEILVRAQKRTALLGDFLRDIYRALFTLSGGSKIVQCTLCEMLAGHMCQLADAMLRRFDTADFTAFLDALHALTHSVKMLEALRKEIDASHSQTAFLAGDRRLQFVESCARLKTLCRKWEDPVGFDMRKGDSHARAAG